MAPYIVSKSDNYFSGKNESHIPDFMYNEGHTKNISKLVTFIPDIIFHLGEYSRVEKKF